MCFRGLVLLAALALTACASQTPEPLKDPPKDSPKETEVRRSLTAGEARIAASGNVFTFALLKQVNREQRNSNIFISPISASMALSVAMNGASGATFDAMRTTLGYEPAEIAEINADYKGLVGTLRALDKTTDFRIANSIWYRQGLSVNKEFLSTATNYFDARVAGLDFNDPASPATINEWVRRATAGKISSVIDRISSADVMFIINAIYFKGIWQLPFDKQRTHAAVFHLPDGGSQPMQQMNLNGRVRHLSAEKFRAIDLLYGNGAFAMTVLLPAPGHDVNELIDALTGEEWTSRTSAFSSQETVVGLPRFKLEYTRTLNGELAALGMGVAFDPQAADFSRLARGGDSLFISSVSQKTFVDVNEEGTEAAAVTGIGIQQQSYSAPVPFIVDRPFIFAIRERQSGTILFVGKVVRIPEA